MAKSYVVPSDGEPERIPPHRRLLQLVLSPYTLFVASQPGIWLVWGPILLGGLFSAAFYAQALPTAPKYAATAGALFFGKMVFSKMAVAFQALVIDMANDHGITIRWPVTVQIRAWQRSGQSPSFEGKMRWRGPLLVAVPVIVAVGAFIGAWILANKTGWLVDHTWFSWQGIHLVTHYWL